VALDAIGGQSVPCLPECPVDASDWVRLRLVKRIEAILDRVCVGPRSPAGG
jgi:hypothetical protein